MNHTQSIGLAIPPSLRQPSNYHTYTLTLTRVHTLLPSVFDDANSTNTHIDIALLKTKMQAMSGPPTPTVEV